MTATVAYIALGSNLGVRERAIEDAARALERHEGIEILRMSDVLETEPLGPRGQSTYLNAVVAIGTALDPFGLLGVCQQIERDGGRDRRHEERWGPRRIDLDILLWGDAIMSSPVLCLPHPALAERGFVLEPLTQIAPDLVHPTVGRPIRCLQERLRKFERRAATGVIHDP